MPCRLTSPIIHRRTVNRARRRRLQTLVSWLALEPGSLLGCAGHLFAMVASVQRVKPHEVFDRHRTETGAHDVLATGHPSTTFLVEPGKRAFQADARLSRRNRSARRVKRPGGLKSRRKDALLQDPVEEQQSEQRAQKS